MTKQCHKCSEGVDISSNINDDDDVEESGKKAKIFKTTKDYNHPPFQKSPNSDRTFESRLLDSEFDDQTPPTIKNKMLDLKVKHLWATVLAPELRHQYYFSTMYYL